MRTQQTAAFYGATCFGRVCSSIAYALPIAGLTGVCGFHYVRMFKKHASVLNTRALSGEQMEAASMMRSFRGCRMATTLAPLPQCSLSR